MPTSRPRHQITETPEVARALDRAARRWPGETRATLLLRLVHAGSASLTREHSEAARHRRAAVEATKGKYGDAFGQHYLADLRQDWPE